MIAIRPTTPENKKPETTQKVSFWSKVFSYTANDQDYTPTLKITKAPSVHKKWNLRRQIRAAITILLIGYILLAAYVLLNPQNALFFK